MSNSFFAIEIIVFKLALNGLYQKRDLLRMVEQQALKDRDAGVGVWLDVDANRFMWPNESVYDAVCGILRSHLRDSIRKECLAHNLPVEPDKNDFFLANALQSDRLSMKPENDANAREYHRQSAFVWYVRCLRKQRQVERIVAAGIVRTLCNETTGELRTLNDDGIDEHQLLFLALGGLAFYDDLYREKEGEDAGLKDWRKATVESFLLAFASLTKRNTVWLADAKWVIEQKTRRLGNYGWWAISGLVLANVRLQDYRFYTMHLEESLQAVDAAAHYYKKPEWIFDARQQVIVNRAQCVFQYNASLKRDQNRGYRLDEAFLID